MSNNKEVIGFIRGYQSEADVVDVIAEFANKPGVQIHCYEYDDDGVHPMGEFIPSVAILPDGTHLARLSQIEAMKSSNEVVIFQSRPAIDSKRESITDYQEVYFQEYDIQTREN